jgi:hypothetical protein
MKRTISLLLAVFTCALAHAGDLAVSTREPLVVVAPDQWRSAREGSPNGAFPFETYRVEPSTNRNAVCLVSVIAKDKQEFADAELLKKIIRASSRPYVASPDELPKVEIKEAKISGGLEFYANFVDPDLAGKPVKQGSYKTATPIILSLGTKYLVKITVLCDEIDGADYKDAMKIVESIRIK